MSLISKDLSSTDYLGEKGDRKAVAHMIDLKDKFVVDVGCGKGRLAKALTEDGARVLGIEPDPIQAEKNRQADPIPGVTFMEAHAEALPEEAMAAEVVIFGRSLHHVPLDLMAPALTDACRVLGEKGTLLVIEPHVEGDFTQLMLPFHNETKVRTAALEALKAVPEPHFARMRHAWYHMVFSWESYDAFIESQLANTFNSYEREQVLSQAVKDCFETGRQDDGAGYRFTQPMRLFCFDNG